MILMVAEHADGAPRKSALELASVGRELARQVARPLAALVLGPEGEQAAGEVARYVPDVYHLDDSRLAPARAATTARAVAQAARELGADVVLLSASRTGVSCGPRIALRLGVAYLEDVTKLEFEGDALVAERLTYLARFSAEVVASSGRAVVSVKPGSVPVASLAEEPGAVHRREVTFEEPDTRLEVSAQEEASRGRVALEDAEVVVCGGRGFGSPDAFERHVVGLAELLGAGVGATRAVVDAGWRPYSEQIGQTGKSVAPRLYLALAVSGAVQHLSGMNRSGIIVAVNKDADAPIFKIADYGIVGDVSEVVPALGEALGDRG